MQLNQDRCSTYILWHRDLLITAGEPKLTNKLTSLEDTSHETSWVITLKLCCSSSLNPSCDTCHLSPEC